MCGIAAIVNISNEAPGTVEALLHMSNQMKKRGPDDEGFALVQRDGKVVEFGGDGTSPDVFESLGISHIKSLQEVDYQIAMIHRRLSIIDLSVNGHQPMKSPDEKIILVFNGEIYNYRELRSEYFNDHEFSSDSDTEVILKAYEKWGTECVNFFNGDFAFVIYDQRNNHVFVARDRFGIKPLFYYSDRNRWIFASEIKTLLSSKLVPVEIDPEGLSCALDFNVVPRPSSVFKNVKSVLPGHVLLIDLKNGSVKEEEYWTVQFRPSNGTFQQYREGIIERLLRSIKYRLIADVEVATFMSGGIDSTLISSLAHSIFPEIKAFTLGLPFNKGADETEQARATAEHVNMRHVVRDLREEEIYSNIQNFVLGFEEPTSIVPPEYLISQVVKENNIKVVLTGVGGDEIFAGYPEIKYLNIWPRLRPFSFLAPLLKYHPTRNINRVINMMFADSAPEYYCSIYSNFNPYEKKSLFIPELSNFNTAENITGRYPIEGLSDLNQMLNLSIKHFLGNHLLYRGDLFSMMHSIETRFPFLDHEFVDYVLSVPENFKLKNGERKYILKSVAEGYISRESLDMRKKGFSVPIGNWINNEISDLFNDSINSLKKREIINAPAIDQHIKRNSGINNKKLWHLMMIEQWFQIFIDD